MKPFKFGIGFPLFFVIIGLIFSLPLGAYAQDVRPVDDGPIHEAFLAPESGDIILTAVPIPPPRPIMERIPAKVDPETDWIPGYWSWQEQWEDFVWVSGVWRHPPPEHMWIPGYWESLEGDWVWFRGFWSPAPLEHLGSFDIAPPDPFNENIGLPPSNDYFWMPGYWQFSPPDQSHFWVSGQWELFDPNWVFVPAHYLWRPDGYIFIPPYWDWPLEARGVVYASVFIPPPVRHSIVFIPVVIIEHPIVVEHLFLHFPDYTCFFGHHHHFHHDFWGNFCCSPPWWGWDAWWGFHWHDQWALWWWWSHPGFPQPLWLSLELANMLPPPGHPLMPMMANVRALSIVTPNGVISPGALRDAIASILGGKPDSLAPILPSKPGILGKILDAAKPDLPPNIFKPGGKRDPDPRRQIQKPETGPSLPEGIRTLRPTVPVKPKIPMAQPPVRRPSPPRATYPPPRPPPSYTPQRPPRRPSWPPARRPTPPRPERPPRYTPPPPQYAPEPPREHHRPWPPRRPGRRPPMHTPMPPSREPDYPGMEPPTHTRPPTYTPPLRMPEIFRPHEVRPMEPPTQTRPPTTAPPPSEVDPGRHHFQIREFQPQGQEREFRDIRHNEPAREEN